MRRIGRRTFIGAAAGAAIIGSARAQVPSGYPAAYQDIITAGQREGRVLIYSNMSADNWRLVIEGFTRRYSGIRVETLDLGSREVMERYLAERSTNSATADLMATAEPGGWLDFRRRNEIMDYASPEAAGWPDWAKPFPGLYTISTDPLVFLWNNALVPEAQRPRTFAQFVENLQRSPNIFRRKVTSYPVHTTPFGYNANFAFVRKHGDQAWQWLEEVAKVTPRFEGSSGPMSEKVTTGEYAIGYFVSAITFWTRLNDPARARILGFDFMRDGQILAMRGIAVPKGSRNVNAAKLMLDYVISAEGQRAFGRGGMTPARPDVSAGDGVRHTYSSIVQAVGGESNVILGNYDPALLTSYEAFTTRWKRIFNIS